MDILWPKMLKYIYFSKRFHAISYIVLKNMFHSWDSPRLLVCDSGEY